eukprot:m.171575 g.171575  ORF g.171575 m.171575 type:complete len:490 (-) comp13499_c1_seq9:144-1613(-)
MSSERPKWNERQLLDTELLAEVPRPHTSQCSGNTKALRTRRHRRNKSSDFNFSFTAKSKEARESESSSTLRLAASMRDLSASQTLSVLSPRTSRRSSKHDVSLLELSKSVDNLSKSGTSSGSMKPPPPDVVGKVKRASLRPLQDCTLYVDTGDDDVLYMSTEKLPLPMPPSHQNQQKETVPNTMDIDSKLVLGPVGTDKHRTPDWVDSLHMGEAMPFGGDDFEDNLPPHDSKEFRGFESDSNDNDDDDDDDDDDDGDDNEHRRTRSNHLENPHLSPPHSFVDDERNGGERKSKLNPKLSISCSDNTHEDVLVPLVDRDRSCSLSTSNSNSTINMSEDYDSNEGVDDLLDIMNTGRHSSNEMVRRRHSLPSPSHQQESNSDDDDDGSDGDDDDDDEWDGFGFRGDSEDELIREVEGLKTLLHEHPNMETEKVHRPHPPTSTNSSNRRQSTSPSLKKTSSSPHLSPRPPTNSAPMSPQARRRSLQYQRHHQ